MENRNITSNDARISDPSQVPVIPLPNPGESGPVYDPETGFDPGAVDDPGQIPTIPLLRPGEGGNPVYDPDAVPGGPIYGVQPLPSYPGYVQPNAVVRFVNATHGYPDLRVSVDNARVVSLLASGDASCYTRIASGTRTITLLGTDGYIYLQKRVSFRQGRAYIVAIANRNGGIDLTAAEDVCYR